MKPKSVTEDRILQLTNDQAEGIVSGSVREWREVARYWRDQHEQQTQRLMGLLPSVSALSLAKQIEQHALREIEAWAKRENAK